MSIMLKRSLVILLCWLIAVHAPAATITGSSISLGDPGPIGATTPSSGAFTTVTASGTVGTASVLGGVRLGFTSGQIDVQSGGALILSGSGQGIFTSTGSYFTWNNDLYLARDSAAVLQIGLDHATVATAQKIKAHDVTTGTGAALTLAGGNGSAAGGVVKIDVSPTTTPATSAQFDATVTAGQTRFLLYDVDNATLERVTVGAADSAGAGFKVLRIPN